MSDLPAFVCIRRALTLFSFLSEFCHSLSVSDLPAFVCIRRSVIVSIVTGSRLRQFVHMGPVGAAIFRAWLHEVFLFAFFL